MNGQHVIDSIRSLAHAIRRDTGLYVTFVEHMHTGGAEGADVSVELASGIFQWWRGSSSPIEGHQVTLEAMLEQMLVWLAERRKEKVA